MVKKTLYPVPLDDLQAILNQLGYFQCKQDQATRRLHWERDDSVTPDYLPKRAPAFITILMPDRACDGYSELVYDRSYVYDLIGRIIGGGDGDVGNVIFAVLQR